MMTPEEPEELFLRQLTPDQRVINAELLAALKACRWCAVQLMEGDIVEQAEAAITKAEGKI